MSGMFYLLTPCNVNTHAIKTRNTGLQAHLYGLARKHKESLAHIGTREREHERSRPSARVLTYFDRVGTVGM